ncbi:hypothetical protein FGO68_gene12855 [Halteria grandinella]|uniref:Uncharacterized protein n=1 Tax=Halteria grandinella TaxID=5974 RepID=A0A8J8NDX5_HALGN|nr:hypothetical protein FGO68_gene12855 [Halteria grandinella]
MISSAGTNKDLRQKSLVSNQSEDYQYINCYADFINYTTVGIRRLEIFKQSRLNSQNFQDGIKFRHKSYRPPLILDYGTIGLEEAPIGLY